MQLGSHTFTQLPSNMTPPRPQKPCGHVVTLTGAAFFAWDAIIVGTSITLQWNAMSTTEFDALDALYRANAAVTFDPTDVTEGSATYTVEIENFSGEYLAGCPETRQNCEMILFIMAEL